MDAGRFFRAGAAFFAGAWARLTVGVGAAAAGRFAEPGFFTDPAGLAGVGFSPSRGVAVAPAGVLDATWPGALRGLAGDGAATDLFAGAATRVLLAAAGVAWALPPLCSAIGFGEGALSPVPAVGAFVVLALAAPARGAVAFWTGAGLRDASDGAWACGDAVAESRKSSIDAPRFFRPCLSQVGFGPRPLQVWPVLGWP